jgi:hypothetical protein
MRVKRELDTSAVESAAAATKKVKREPIQNGSPAGAQDAVGGGGATGPRTHNELPPMATTRQQLHNQAEALSTWQNSDGENMLPAQSIEPSSAQASDLLLHFENNQPCMWKERAQVHYSGVTNVSTSTTPDWSWSLSTLPAPSFASGYVRVSPIGSMFTPNEAEAKIAQVLPYQLRGCAHRR